MSINILGAIIAAILSMGLGFLWYSQTLFGARWIREMKLSGDEMQGEGMKKQLIWGFAGELVIALVFSFMMGVVGVFTIGQALSLGFWLWLGFMLPIMLGSVLWERKSVTLLFINSSYRLVAMLLIGIILSII